MSDDVFAQHHDFFGTHPKQPEPPRDELAELRAHNRRIIVSVFTSEEGKAVLGLLRGLATALPAHPIEYENPEKATQFLWWRAARAALIDEVETILRQETKT
jgi:hypothetical protein